jgi:hypothetical protein
MRWPDGVSASPANQIAVPDAPKLAGIVEANETYIRGKQRGPTSSFPGIPGFSVAQPALARPDDLSGIAR